jgi:hypothetical protein
LVDVSDLGSDAARHGGSSPSTRTQKGMLNVQFSIVNVHLIEHCSLNIEH